MVALQSSHGLPLHTAIIPRYQAVARLAGMIEHLVSEEGFEWQKSSLREAYRLLGAKTPRALSNRYSEEDQILMRARTWDYNNPALITNQIKGIVESVAPDTLHPTEEEWAEEILWFWYHHAISCAIGRYRDRNAAKVYAQKALEHQSIEHPNKITKLFDLLLNEKVTEAKTWAARIDDADEIKTAAELIQEFEQGKWFNS